MKASTSRTIPTLALFLGLGLGLGIGPAQAVPLPEPVTDDDFHPTDPKKVALGKLLAFDKLLSGNRNISCLTCHHPMAATGDGLALPVGEGGAGLGVTRDTGTGLDAVHERVPRNAPHLFAIGAKELEFLFHDGRVSVDPNHPAGFQTPAGPSLPPGLDNVVAAQAMFPVTSGTEMAGQAGENTQADAAATAQNGDFSAVWSHIADKIREVPQYVELFVDAFPEVTHAADIGYVHVANAIAAFEIDAWRCTNSPFDAFLRRDRNAITRHQLRGLHLFYGKAGCSNCHDGKFLTDNDFHAIAMPQIGPGKGDGPDGLDDFGRGRETGKPEDRYRFRTPTLRMVAATAPYGHAGAYATLEAVVRHHLDPVGSLHGYDPTQARLPSRPDLDALDFVVMSDPERVAAIAAANELDPVHLRDQEVADLVAFLHALTDPGCLDLRRDVPPALPSGLPVFD
jgi:cytochrome c peroxidase